jgi:HJR/Mrr/RecB family endonuclease
MKIEALARVAADAEFRKKRSAEFGRLVAAKHGDERAAMVALVTKHSKEYGATVAAARDRLRAKAAAEARSRDESTAA